jgi:hypothetical protein
MHLSDYRRAELEARGTSGSSLRATALGLLLAFSQPTMPLILIPQRRVVLGQTPGTAAEVMSLRITEADLFFQINRVYDDLLKLQEDLDRDAKQVLYGRLWDLYS